MTALGVAILTFVRKRWLGLAILGCLVVVVVTANRIGRWWTHHGAVEAAHARAGVIVSEGGERASGAAAEAMAGLGERDAIRTQQAQENRDAILAAPNAHDDAGVAGDAGLAGLCRKSAYRDHPRCVGLRGTNPTAAPR